jgi:hypothetical protein
MTMGTDAYSDFHHWPSPPYSKFISRNGLYSIGDFGVAIVLDEPSLLKFFGDNHAL